MKEAFKTKRRIRIRYTRLLVFIFILLSLFSLFYYRASLRPVSADKALQPKEIAIPKGAGLKNIADILKKEGMIRDKFTFELYCKLNKKAGKIIAGKYYLGQYMSTGEIVNILASGKAQIDTVKFTIPEGYELRQIVDKLVEMGLVNREAFINSLNNGKYNYDFIKDIPDRENKLEGYLFPDTYEVYKDASPEDIINKMLERFSVIYNPDYQKRAKELNMTMDQVITLASIIEREAKLDSERSIISAVFQNRIKKHMLLQSCATVQYILKERKEVLSYKDVQIDSPYNTYKNPGLPPGPIASPGVKSIEAALYPADVDYLYFVANGDGSHVFSRTYEEHIDAQNKMKK